MAEQPEYDKVTQASMNGIYVKAQELDRGHNEFDAPALRSPGSTVDARTHASDAESHASSHATDSQTHASTHASDAESDVQTGASDAATHASDGS